MLEVTVTFQILPYSHLLHLDPSQAAAQVREDFIDTGDVVEAVHVAVEDEDYQLKVQPVFHD